VIIILVSIKSYYGQIAPKVVFCWSIHGIMYADVTVLVVTGNVLMHAHRSANGHSSSNITSC